MTESCTVHEVSTADLIDTGTKCNSTFSIQIELINLNIVETCYEYTVFSSEFSYQTVKKTRNEAACISVRIIFNIDID